MGLRFRAIKSHAPDSPSALLARKGERLRFQRRPTEWGGWIWCTAEDGMCAWVPESWVEIEGESCIMLRDYVSRELPLNEGDEVAAGLTESGWAWVRAGDGQEGWVPLECLEEKGA